MFILKVFGYKKRKVSINRSLNDYEIKKNLSLCDKFSYWWFHNS